MGGSFETSAAHSSPVLQPLRVPARAPEVFQEVKDMVHDLPKWRIVSADDRAMTLVCERSAGLLGGASTITITVEGPEGIPSATVHVKSVTESGLVSRDKANVAEFLHPFRRRVG